MDAKEKYQKISKRVIKLLIDCGCSAIRDAMAVSGGDLKRIDAVQRRMRREMILNTTGQDEGNV